MARIYKGTPTVFAMVGIVLLLASLVLVPQGRALGDDPPAAPCDSALCEAGCTIQSRPNCNKGNGFDYCQTKLPKCTGCSCLPDPNAISSCLCQK